MESKLLSPPFTRMALGIAVAMLIAGVAGCSDLKTDKVAETVRPAYVTEVRPGGSDSLRFVGEVRAIKRADLNFPVSGRVALVHVEAGDVVRAGQVMAVLDKLPMQAQLSASLGDLARAEAQLLEARQRLERVRRAQADNATSAGEYGAAQAEVSAAAAAVRAADAQRDLAKWSLDHATLRAPVAGVVAARSIEPGQAIGPGAPALSIDGDGRELSALVPARLAVKAGQVVQLRGESGETVSRVIRVASRLEAGGVRRVVLSAPDNASVGSTWSVAFSTLNLESTASAVQIPLRAVLPDGQQGQGHVLRLGKDGRTVESVAVRLGLLHGDHVEIVTGLSIGERVVVAGAAAIQAGTVVQPVAYKAVAGGVTP